MLKDLNIPRMGSVENARLVAWKVQIGEAYAAGDTLYEIETDKTTTEVEADEAGVLASQLASEGDEFKVGDRIGQWAAAGTNAATLRTLLGGEPAPLTAVEVEPVAAPAHLLASLETGLRPLPRSAAAGQRISPLARRLAALHRVDPGTLQGSGPRGRITGKDILKASASTSSAESALVVQAAAPVSSAAPPVVVEGQSTFLPHSMRRRTIANRMVQAAAIPSLTADMEIDLSALLARRRTMPGVSVLALVAHEAVASLLDHPRLNAHWHDDGMLQWDTVHLGIAVDTPDGLVVPVINHAERLNPLGLTHAIAERADKARNGRLRLDEMEGGTFTISNPGSVGPVIRAEALLNPPQVALLGLPGMVRTPLAIPDGDGWSIAVRPVLRASLTFDHRALDGGPVIEYLNTLKSRIESL